MTGTALRDYPIDQDRHDFEEKAVETLAEDCLAGARPRSAGAQLLERQLGGRWR